MYIYILWKKTQYICIYIYINYRSVSLSVCNSCSHLPSDQPWQVRDYEKANNRG